MNFHNVSANQLVPEPVPNHMIDLQQVRAVTVAGTVFKPFDNKQAFLRTTPGACANLAIGPSNSQLAE